MDTRNYAQLQPFVLYGSGASQGDVTLTLTNFNSIDGVPLTMADFGTKGYGTVEPGSSSQEEQISFSGLTNNSNGTVTLTGVKNVAFLSPYTETAGLSKSHAGATRFVISNTSGFYNDFANKDNDETINGEWTFVQSPQVPTPISSELTAAASVEYVNDVAISGAPNASTVAKGIVQLPTQAQVDARTATGSTGAALTPTPANLRTVLMHDYAASSAGTDTYAITLTPAVTAYTTGDIYIFKADVANTGGCTLNVNGVGAKTITGFNGATLKDNDITANSVNIVVYTGTNMELVSSTGSMFVSNSGREIYGVSAAGTDTYAVTLSPVPLAYTAGMTVRFYADVGNTDGATLNVNGLGAKTLVRPSGTALQTGDITAGNVITAVYDGTNFQISGLVPAALTGGVSSNASSLHAHAVVANAQNVTANVDGVWVPTVTTTLPAGVLSTKHGLKIKGFGVASATQTGGGAPSVDMRLVFGGTTFALPEPVNAGNTGSDGLFEFEILLFNFASASAQRGMFSGSQQTTNAGSTSITGPTALSGTENTAGTIAVSLDIQANTGGEACSVTMQNATIEYVFAP